MVDDGDGRRRMKVGRDVRGRRIAHGFADSYRLSVAFGGPGHWYVALWARTTDGVRYEPQSKMRYVGLISPPMDEATSADDVVDLLAHGERPNPALQRWLEIDDRLYEQYLEDKAAGEMNEEGE